MTDHTGDRELFENEYSQVEAKFSEYLQPVMNQIYRRGFTKEQPVKST